MDARDLIAKAFEVAGPSTAMTIAVLKNRMLQLSNRSFDEKALGHPSFGAFLAANRDLVEVDSSTRPPTVRLATPPDDGGAKPAPESVRIRPDLWQAVMDYSSGAVYVWDAASGVARARDDDDEDDAVLPTATPTEIHVLRHQFEGEHQQACTDTERARLAKWAEHGLGTSALPGRLRGPWNKAQKDFVKTKLEDWFNERGLGEPGNVVQPVERPSRRKSDELREWIHAVVDAMTEDELRALPLPSAATLRASRR